jgi:hypothetical protein
MKRYDCELKGSGDWTRAEMEQCSDGEYVRYDDIAPLLRELSILREHKRQQENFSNEVMAPLIDWLQDKAAEWQKGTYYECSEFEKGANTQAVECGEELEAKLKEFL